MAALAFTIYMHVIRNLRYGIMSMCTLHKKKTRAFMSILAISISNIKKINVSQNDLFIVIIVGFSSFFFFTQSPIHHRHSIDLIVQVGFQNHSPLISTKFNNNSQFRRIIFIFHG